MTDRVFVDTNVLVYAHDREAGERHEIARQVVADLWAARTAVISTQVLQEFYVNATRKIPKPLSRAVARQVLRTYSAWQTEIISPGDIDLASDLEEQHRLGFWDALIVAAAIRGGASTLLTEDFGRDRRISGIRVRNPFPATKA